jgi:LmbE family N-acetylglucosaminyl deacetylase
MMPMNIILSPHFDDAVLSLGGLLANEGRESIVATFFAGTPPRPLARLWDLASGFKDSTEAMRERVEEDRRALNLLGVPDDRIRAYAHLDLQYRREKGAPAAPEPELQASIQQEIDALIRESGPKPVKVFMPGIEAGKAHPDHVMLKRAALAAARALPADGAEFYLYQDLPYAISLMEAAYPRKASRLFMREKAERRDYSLIGQSIARGSLAIAPIAIPLENADMERKCASVACYASQLGNLGRDLPERVKRFGAAQARALSLSAPYCEVAYVLRPLRAASQDQTA